ncbi:hypothetical protein JTE90_016754 [Oedothorax gibbosus]|uniref:SGTA homodimerisation domain-containing protein n=1 Tax=Oedothorax gibbosus TaxID=931172 RepID=A0AAV6VYJ6_9ARAC|nr:hypothetical protein JTE90_016754 [Oedothorax gibbosus]
MEQRYQGKWSVSMLADYVGLASEILHTFITNTSQEGHSDITKHIKTKKHFYEDQVAASSSRMPHNIKLIISIINFLKQEALREVKNPDTQESLEVAVQCLQTAYDLDSKDPRLNKTEKYPLEEIWGVAMQTLDQTEQDDVRIELFGTSVERAERMKIIGNQFMKAMRFQEAIKHYTAAIEYDNNNAVYYCNRAAAYSKLNEFQNAIKDCEKAVQIDPLYAKAYGRMGLAYISLNQSESAITAFQKAVEIEPQNESYQTNLKIALEKKDKPTTPAAALTSLNNVDWQSLFSNPAFRNMASSIMQDPNIINALSSGLSNSFGQAASSDGSTGESTSEGGGLDMLFEAGQYLAQQMQAANPDLIEQVRQNRNSENKDSEREHQEE